MIFRRSAIFVLTLPFLFSTFLASQRKDKADLLITGGTVVTMDAARSILDDGAVVVKGDTIVAVGPRTNSKQIRCRTDHRRKGQAGFARIHQRPHPRAHDAFPRPAR